MQLIAPEQLDDLILVETPHLTRLRKQAIVDHLSATPSEQLAGLHDVIVTGATPAEMRFVKQCFGLEVEPLPPADDKVLPFEHGTAEAKKPTPAKSKH
jgi:hypothetical protein